ncbi:NUDIX hydrolase [Aspergillus melleus]|uniref:NUDIX hydrolase n=1 Tax=Aspergillus melleus TaxID=138277 RepID=UPI001E8DDCFF|nr:uncharacterized protein LDX57_000124 [Aspergillus melleus]KAH8422368.1 hypothetical protein LDX57_000124 [Aspergillus melleus]
MTSQPPVKLNYTYSSHLHQYALSLSTFRASNPQYTHFVVGGLIYSSTCNYNWNTPASPTNTNNPLPNSFPKSNPTPQTRVLLLQRSQHDSLPGFWEGPGGLCEVTDDSILAGAAREVYEESGLHVSRFVDLIAVDEWTRVKSDEVVRAAKFTFLVEVEEAETVGWEEMVNLEPEEHEEFVWATEEEVKYGVEGNGSRLRFVGDQGKTLLRGFGLFEGRE